MLEARPITIINDPRRASAMLANGRLELLRELRVPQSASTLARKLSIPRQRLNYHLRVLERAGLVECIEERRKGNCRERMLRATAQSFSLDLSLLGDLGLAPSADADKFSPAYLLALFAQTVMEVSTLQRMAFDQPQRRPSVTISSEIRFATDALRDEFAQELADTLARLTAKYHVPSARDGRDYRLLAMAHPKLDPENHCHLPDEEARNAARARVAPGVSGSV